MIKVRDMKKSELAFAKSLTDVEIKAVRTIPKMASNISGPSILDPFNFSGLIISPET